MEQADNGVDEAMKVYFNDVTLTDCDDQNRLLLREMKGVWDAFSGRTKGTVRYMHSLPCDDPLYDRRGGLGRTGLASFYDSICQSEDKELAHFLTHTIFPGFEPEISAELKNKYDASEYKVKLPPPINGTAECKIMGWAKLNQGLTFGLASSEFWNNPEKPCVTLSVEEYKPDSGKLVSTTAFVDCVTRIDHLDRIRIQYPPAPDAVAEEESYDDPPEIVKKKEKGKIIIIGVEGRESYLRQTAAALGFDPGRFEFYSYNYCKHHNYKKWTRSPDVLAIMCGPTPHNCQKIGNHTSLLAALLDEADQYHPVVELRNAAGELQVTQESFQNGLEVLIKQKAIYRNFDC